MAVANAAYHFDKLYSYAIPVEFAATLRPGMRVLVPFGGGNRKRQGIVLGRKPVQSLEKLKPLVSILDSEPVLSPELLRLVAPALVIRKSDSAVPSVTTQPRETTVS